MTTLIQSKKYSQYEFSYDGNIYTTTIVKGATNKRLVPFDDHENWGKYPTAHSLVENSYVEKLTIVETFVGEKDGEPARQHTGILSLKNGKTQNYPIIATARYILRNESSDEDKKQWTWEFDYPKLHYWRMGTVLQSLYVVDKTEAEMSHFKKNYDEYKFFINS